MKKILSVLVLSIYLLTLLTPVFANEQLVQQTNSVTYSVDTATSPELEVAAYVERASNRTKSILHVAFSQLIIMSILVIIGKIYEKADDGTKRFILLMLLIITTVLAMFVITVISPIGK